MRSPRIALIPSLFVFAMVVSLPLAIIAQTTRDKFVITAKAGGVNAVTGRATMRAHGGSEWQQLSIKEDLEAGDAVRTGHDGRVEMLLNPGAYLRIGENSEFELSDNSLQNLELRLIRGTAIVEATGFDGSELLINITTPHTRMAIVRKGLYRVNVVPGNATELIVRKGRVMLEGSHTLVNGGNKVVFSNSSFSVAKLRDADKNTDDLEVWSKDRAKTVAQANRGFNRRDMSLAMASFNDGWGRFSPRFSGIWMFSPSYGCYTFLPYFGGWGSPYGSYYNGFYGGYGRWGRPGGYYNPRGYTPTNNTSGGSTSQPRTSEQRSPEPRSFPSQSRSPEPRSYPEPRSFPSETRSSPSTSERRNIERPVP